MTAIDIELLEVTEEDRVRWWRQDALERAGYGVKDAAEIARATSVDLHEAMRLAKRGCPPELARRILL